MPRGSRIDAPGAVHHIMVRGIERRKIFVNDADRDYFLSRLGEILPNTGTECLAWSLIPNHFHLLLRTGKTPISNVMRKLLTGYAIWYNRTHRRVGHLFQNRFKSILCQEDTYLLELVRYIHLNPLRSGLVKTINELDKYLYSGHSILMGNNQNNWQSKDYILRMFGKKASLARNSYRKFVEQGIEQGKRYDLTGGGLIRSAGGWAGLMALRQDNNYQRSDERILGDGDFVNRVLDRAEESMDRRHSLKARGIDLEKITDRVAKLTAVKSDDIWRRTKKQPIVDARSILCFWAVEDLGVTMASLGRKLGLSIPAISKSVTRGKQICEASGFKLIED